MFQVCHGFERQVRATGVVIGIPHAFGRLVSFSKTEIDDMIRKPTNLLLTKTLKSALVELTAAESETQLSFSQVR